MKEKRPLSYYMRTLHRDFGYFTIGLTILFSLSGILLVYRDTDFLKFDTEVESKLALNLSKTELCEMMRMRESSEIKETDSEITFPKGKYDKKTGIAIYTVKKMIFPLNKFIKLHKTYGGNSNHWFVTLYGILLTFLAISSFWMFSKNNLKRGLILCFSGIIFTIIVLLI